MDISSYGNVLLQRNEPWKIWKQDPESDLVKSLMNLCLQIVASLSIISEPFIPFTAQKLRRLLNLQSIQSGDFNQLISNLKTEGSILSAGHSINEPELLFAKINDRKDKSRLELIEKQKAKLETLKNQQQMQDKKAEPVKDECTYEDFIKVDFRTGTIINAESIKKANKLLKLTVDLGFEQRTVVSGIAKHYEPQSILGQKVVLVANLAPRKMMGIESQGMILMAENKDGKLLFVSPEDLSDNGSIVK